MFWNKIDLTKYKNTDLSQYSDMYGSDIFYKHSDNTIYVTSRIYGSSNETGSVLNILTQFLDYFECDLSFLEYTVGGLKLNGQVYLVLKNYEEVLFKDVTNDEFITEKDEDYTELYPLLLSKYKLLGS